jgi:hypothetical protein
MRAKIKLYFAKTNTIDKIFISLIKEKDKYKHQWNWLKKSEQINKQPKQL